MKAAVIGAGGYVGRHLCQELQSRGAEVLRYSSGDASGISRETGLLPAGFRFPVGVDSVYFLAQSPHHREMPAQSTHLVTVNCVAAIQAAEAARKAGAVRFIYASTGNVYAPSFAPLDERTPLRRDNWYSLSKVLGEEALSLYRKDLDVTAARIFGVYGPGQDGRLVPTIAASVQAGREVFVERHPADVTDQGGLRVSLLYIDDLVDALIHLATIKGCDAINLAGREHISVRDLATRLAAEFSRPVSIRVSEACRAFDLIANTSLQRRLLGEPRIDMETGLKRTVASMA